MIRSSLTAKLRQGKGKQFARRVRHQGMIPAVLYGPGKESRNLEVNPTDLTRAISTKAGENTLIDLTVEGETARIVLVREIQVDPISREYLHADLYEVPMDKKIRVPVPVMIRGEALGVKEGGVLDQIIREIEVSCLPTEIPEQLEIDVSALKIGGAAHAREIPMPPGVEILIDADQTVATVVAPRKEEELAPAVPAAEAAPEVPERIGEKKPEGEEGEEGEKAEAGKEKAPKEKGSKEKGDAPKEKEKKSKGDKK
jgi:large subunit ribosomal protein L25